MDGGDWLTRGIGRKYGQINMGHRIAVKQIRGLSGGRLVWEINGGDWQTGDKWYSLHRLQESGGIHTQERDHNRRAARGRWDRGKTTFPTS